MSLPVTTRVHFRRRLDRDKLAALLFLPASHPKGPYEHTAHWLRPTHSLTQGLIVSLAAIGFAFDIYELLMMQFIIKDLIVELTGFRPGSDGFRFWGSLLFYVPALAGGIFGLLGGYLTDRLGRRRVLTWSILIYACSTFAAGFSTSNRAVTACRERGAGGFDGLKHAAGIMMANCLFRASRPPA